MKILTIQTFVYLLIELSKFSDETTRGTS